MAKRNPKRSKIRLIIAAILVVAVIALCACIPESGWDYLYDKAGITCETDGCDMSVHFIDVGQGDCTLIKLDSGEAVLIDSGEDIKADKVKSYLKKEKVRELDYCFVTHPHTDHYAGMTKILESYPAKTVVMPSIPQKDIPKEPEYDEFIDYIGKNSENVLFTRAGKAFTVGGADIKILGPLSDNDNLNAMSLVIRVSLGSASFIITGDCTKEEESEIVSKYSGELLKCSVLKAGHHGSGDSTGDGWLDALNPDAVVFSVGRNNKYSHPAQDVLTRLDSRGIKYYRTDYCGDIVFKIENEKIDVIW